MRAGCDRHAAHMRQRAADGAHVRPHGVAEGLLRPRDGGHDCGGGAENDERGAEKGRADEMAAVLILTGFLEAAAR